MNNGTWNAYPGNSSNYNKTCYVLINYENATANLNTTLTNTQLQSNDTDTDTEQLQGGLHIVVPSVAPFFLNDVPIRARADELTRLELRLSIALWIDTLDDPFPWNHDIAALQEKYQDWGFNVESITQHSNQHNFEPNVPNTKPYHLVVSAKATDGGGITVTWTLVIFEDPVSNHDN